MSEDYTNAPSPYKVVGPPKLPIEAAKANLRKLEERVDNLTAGLEDTFGTLSEELDEAFTEVWSTLQVMLTVQGALVDSVQALTADPSQPHSSANKARGIINDAMEAAYGPDEGSADDGVVPDAAGDQTGDS